jgi:choline dehydrogenase-like flavoprotein
LDSADFVPHAGNPNSGWPIAKSDLDSYAAETDEILDLQPIPAGRFPTDLSPLKPIYSRTSPPTRFRTKYGEELKQSTKIRMYLNANLVDAALDDSHRSVTEFQFKSFGRIERFAVRATYFVLCLGGIENPRFLLNTRLSARHAIGNQYDLIGRNFCEHLSFDLGVVLFKESLVALALQSAVLPAESQSGIYKLGPEPTFMDHAGILNFYFKLMRFLAPKESYLRAFGCSTSLTRKLAEAIGAQCYSAGLLKISAEQALNPESRVRLADGVDRFGLRRAALDWRLSEIDLRTIRVAAVECGRVFAKRDVARVKLADWLLDPTMDFPLTGKQQLQGANHHMCTTRMSSDPRLGVVDANCRVHGMENLYLGGSSVFATSGCSNPTYTIVQLALRLADHLNDRLG